MCIVTLVMIVMFVRNRTVALWGAAVEVTVEDGKFLTPVMIGQLVGVEVSAVLVIPVKDATRAILEILIRIRVKVITLA